jgi:hypothetical protein
LLRIRFEELFTAAAGHSEPHSHTLCRVQHALGIQGANDIEETRAGLGGFDDLATTNTTNELGHDTPPSEHCKMYPP